MNTRQVCVFTAIIPSSFFYFQYFSLFSLSFFSAIYVSYFRANPQSTSINHDRIMQK